jgi:YNFM family putative membrane transporter
LTLPAHLPTLVLGLALVTLANWCGVTSAQLGVAAASETDRGAASSVYYSLYYFAGALGGYLPGLAWERYGWDGVAVSGWVSLTLAAAVLALRARRSYG